MRATTPTGSRTAADRIRNAILKGSAWVFLGKFLGTLIALAVNALLARLLTKQEVGAYFLAFSVVMIGSTVSQLGLNKTVVRLVAASVATNRTGRARDAIRVAFFVGGSTALLLGTLLALGPGRTLAREVFGSEMLADAMPFVAGWMVAMALQTLVAETFRGFKRFWTATLFGGLVVDVFLLAVFGMLWLQDESPSLADALTITMAATALAALIGGAALYPRYARLRRGRGVADTREVLGISLPLLVVSLSSFFVGTGVDLWVIAAFEPTDQAALYGAASRLVFFVATPLIVVSQVVPPIIAELHAQGRRHELERALRAIATLTTMPAAIVLLVFLAAGGAVMALVFGEGYREAGTVLAVLSVARLYAVYTGSCGVALTMTGHQQTMMRITLLTAVFGLVAELLMVQPYGIVGVALATAAAQILQNTLQLISTHRAIGIWTHAELSLRPVMELTGRSGRGR